MMAGTAQVRRDPEVRVFRQFSLRSVWYHCLWRFGLLRERGSEKLRLNRKIVPLGGDDAGLAAEQDQTAKLVERDIRLPNGIGVREEFSARRRAPRKEISERNAVHPP